jgi:hypothetical protein
MVAEANETIYCMDSNRLYNHTKQTQRNILQTYTHVHPFKFPMWDSIYIYINMDLK